MPARGVPQHSDADMIAAVQRVAKAIGRTPTFAHYTVYREPHEATGATMVGRLGGTWNDVLEAAGLPLNRQRYTSKGRYSDEDLLDSVKEAVRACGGEILTVRRYEEWRPRFYPSTAIIRRRLRPTIGTWDDIVRAAGGRSGGAHFPVSAGGAS